MKRLLATIALSWLLVNSYGQSPNFQEFFSQKKTQINYLLQQIAALKVHLERLKEGYDIVQKGLNTVSEIRDSKFAMDRTYIGSLKTVSPIVRNSPVLKACLGLQQRILLELQSLNQECHRDEMYTDAERDYVASVYKNVLDHCNNAMAELEIVTTDGQADMQDEERISRLEKVHENLVDIYSFSQDFVASTRLLSLQRRKETEQINTTRKLYHQI